ncbi:MAG: hypothetical protein KAS23_17280 [Anaerohalosphaera sp.]|nr:hypothetical protein [Anaerohalosphaera sp.]
MIDFSKERWIRIKEDACKWWKGDLERPLIQVRLKGNEPGRPVPELPYNEFIPQYDLNVPAEAIIDRWDYEFCCTKFLGDAFPNFCPNLGAGVIAEFLGSRLEDRDDTVWFHPVENFDPASTSLKCNKDSIWFRRLNEVIQAAVECWNGRVQISLTDIGGNLDILASLRGSQELAMDIFTDPENVKRLSWEAHEAWWSVYDQTSEIIKDVNPGYTSWASIFSEEPHYMLQSDFCFMIGPEMFEEFVKPELQTTARRLTNVFYHLDGPGQLTHLDSLLEIEDIRGIQWIPGAGQPEIDKWPDVYRKILQAGKLIQIFSSQYSGGFEIMDILADQLGSAKGIVYIVDGDISQQAEAEKLLVKYNFA